MLQYVLRVQPVEYPEELLEIDPMEKGSLIHDVLERWLDEQLAAGPPPPAQPWPPEARARMRELAEQACDAAEQRGVTGYALLWRRDRPRIVADLERFVDADDTRRRELGLVPLAAEWAFGIPGQPAPAVAIDLGDGRSVRVRGRIDRLDRCADGSLVVADYKTGSTYSYRGLGEDNPLGDGDKLQLAIYGLAVRDTQQAAGVRSEYWFTSTRGEFKRIGYPLTDAVVASLQRALTVAADGIAAGRFPMRPPEPGWSMFTECRFCDPDDLGTAERYRDWERVRLAAELRDYVAYMEPAVLTADADPDTPMATS
ncbi:MAG TPA: PD-(D/E)XK nuclease family protein [Egibacteraceae bacterium]|nr:PD-(D/E)XK nuclease family protein [Egibacteraceae bacterium]